MRQKLRDSEKITGFELLEPYDYHRDYLEFLKEEKDDSEKDAPVPGC